MTLRDDTRGVSIPVTHAMTIGITALLLVGLMVGAGSFLDRQQKTVARGQLSDIGGDLADLVHGVDRLNETGERVNVTIEPSYPQSVAGSPYTIELRSRGGSGTNGVVVLDSSTIERPVRIPVSTETPIDDSSARGESPTVVIRHDDSGGHCIGLRECSP